MTEVRSFTPREVVGELDRYIVGQGKAKRAVAIALRNRWRRKQVPEELREEITPKNIILIGPTGVGKTEIARRLAKLAQAPFIKVEASKFTEVGYVGRDVESIVRDLVEVAIQVVRTEQRENVRARAEEHAEQRLIQVLSQKEPAAREPTGTFVVSSGGAITAPKDVPSSASDLRKKLRSGELDDVMVELEVTDVSSPLISIFGGPGGAGGFGNLGGGAGFDELESKLKDMLGNIPGAKGKGARRKMRVADARRMLEDEEASKLVDMEQVKHDARERTEQAGIVFLDEIDKVAGGKNQSGPDISREGVQRDLLPIVEGSTVSTKYGPIKTDHILFIAAGAFHVSKVSDLIPELQGRFPIRVELDSLTRDDFVRILTEPKNALTRQYQALMKAEGIELRYTDAAIAAIADYAEQANRQNENIGARRLSTIMEALLDELSYSASERVDREVVIDEPDVRRVLGPILEDKDLSRFIL